MYRVMLILAAIAVGASESNAQIGRGGRPAMPQGRPQMPQARPQIPSFSAAPRPQMPQVRPQMPQTRPQMPQSRPQMPQTRPQMPQTRPNLPNTNLPSVKPGMVPRPTTPTPQLPQTRPNLPTPQVPQTRPNLPTPGVKPQTPSTRPQPLPNRPELPSTRPSLPNRPELPNTRPSLPNRPELPNTRPTLPNRPELPNTRPTLPNRPELPTTRPNLPNWPGNNGNSNILKPGVLPNRPNIDVNNRPDWLTRPNINNNNFNNNIINNNVINNKNFNVIAPTIYNPARPYGGYTRPYYGGVYRPYGWANYGNSFVWGNYYVGRYYPWHCGYWNSYWRYPPGFIPRPIPFGWFLPPTYTVQYVNPYWVEPPVTQTTVINYSMPIPVESKSEVAAPVETPLVMNATVNGIQPGNEPTAKTADDTAETEAASIFDTAREQFKKGDTAAAQATVEKAIAKLPQDPTLHEFRALTLFAQQKYQESAAAIYAVLAAGPGWNADTLYALYDDKLTYAKQLAALEQFATANATNGPAQFLLGYQYLTLGDQAKATAAFNKAAALEPKDELSKMLAKGLTANADSTQE
jgi:tetratricopeptide (TPR) repeat protein